LSEEEHQLCLIGTQWHSGSNFDARKETKQLGKEAVQVLPSSMETAMWQEPRQPDFLAGAPDRHC
jgi:hypothetical protein